MISIPHARDFVLLHWDSNNEEVKSRLILSNLKGFISPLAFRDHSFPLILLTYESCPKELQESLSNLCSQSVRVLSKYF